MPNYEKAARRAARRYGIDPDIFVAQLRQESGLRPGLTSSAGARGIAQFIPSTAKQYGVNLDDGRVRDDLDGAARYMRDNLDRTGDDYRAALSIYNSGRPDAYKDPGFAQGQTYNYVRNIMGSAKVRSPSRRAPEAPQRAPEPAYRTETTPGVDNSGLRRQLVGEFLREGGIKNPNAVLGLAAQYGQAADVPGVTTRVPLAGQPKVRAPKSSTAPSPGGRLPKSGENNWGVLEHVGRSGLYLQEKYGIKEIGGYRANDPYPDHPSRKALDLMVYNDRKKGSRIARELTRDHKRHGVKYIIWNQRIWHPGEGWRKMEDRGSPTQNHKDHVHVLYE